MRVLGAMLVLLPMLAFAGWREIGTVTTPVSDVQMVDAGVVLATSAISGAVALQVTDAGVTTLNSLAGTFVGAGYFGANCLLGLSGAVITPSPGCGSPTPLGAGTWNRFRLVSNAPLGIAVVTSTNNDTLWAGPGAGPGWSALGLPASSSSTRSLQTARIGGVDYAAVNSGVGLRVSVDAGAPFPITGPANWRDAAPFALKGAPAILGLTTSSLQLIRDYRTPVVFTPVMPAGLFPRFVGISGALGMVTTTTNVMLSPIPDPARPAETWVTRPAPLGLERINCIDDRYCAAASDAGVIWFWENEVAPGVAVVVPPVDVGQTVRLMADAGDGDGDPVFVSWSSDAGVLTSVAGIADGTQIDFTAPAVGCVPLALEVTVTDGLLEHDRTVLVPVTVLARGALQTNVNAQVAPAGGPAVTFNAFIDGGCDPASLSWSTATGQMGSGPAFTWTPPATECNSDGGQRAITVTATWLSASPPTTSVIDVSITPWGAPNAPVFSSPARQASGSQVDYRATDVEHVCSASGDFPGTILEWTIDAGASQVLGFDGGLRVIAPECAVVPGQVTASAVRRVWGDSTGRVSDAGTLVVDVDPIAALDASTEFFGSVQGDAGVLFGLLKVDAGCLDQRNAFANVTVSSAGAPVAQGDFAVKDGGWALSIPGGCSGGTYEVVAQLFENGAATGATDQGSITLPFTQAGIGALSSERVDVSCGVGARSSLTLLPEPNACAAASFSWRSVSGPALAISSGSGETLELQSEALDFSVVGEQVELEWTADAGAGNSVTATRRIELGVQPFVEVSVKARPPLRREEEAVVLDVMLRNTTECAVDGVSVALPFSGGTPISESILVDGVRATARSTEDGLVVDGVTVPASGVSTIRLSVRSRLLSSPSVAPVASVRGYVVSIAPPSAAPSTGCGCSQVEVSALVLAVLMVWRRRRSAPHPDPLPASQGEGDSI
ncbi:MAG: hypothetical protein Q8N23_22015 [Archangium sp.]|nr:hypothetical protein [Archangium sp.]MDP3573702.1 hypothetical protein [Archangium sp.]